MERAKGNCHNSASETDYIVRHTKIRGGEGDEQNFGVETKKYHIFWRDLNAEKMLKKSKSKVYADR